MGNDLIIHHPFRQWLTAQVLVDDPRKGFRVTEVDRVGGIEMAHQVSIGR